MKKPCRKSGKIKYDSHESAAKRAGEILTGGNCDPGVTEMRTYLCPDCNKWHITSKQHEQS